MFYSYSYFPTSFSVILSFFIFKLKAFWFLFSLKLHSKRFSDKIKQADLYIAENSACLSLNCYFLPSIPKIFGVIQYCILSFEQYPLIFYIHHFPWSVLCLKSISNFQFLRPLLHIDNHYPHTAHYNLLRKKV